MTYNPLAVVFGRLMTTKHAWWQWEVLRDLDQIEWVLRCAWSNWSFDMSCDVHTHHMPDGRCSCPHQCGKCGTEYEGYDHSVEQCRDSLVAQYSWIRTIDKWPPSGQFVWVVANGYVQRQAAYLSGALWHWADEEADRAPQEVITHWMLIKPAPKERT